MNKKRLSILITTVISACILTGVSILNIKNTKEATSYETLKGSMDAFSDSKILLKNFKSIAYGNDINVSKDGEISAIASLNSNINSGNAFSKEFIKANKDFFKEDPVDRIMIGDNFLSSIESHSIWNDGNFKVYFNGKIKRGKEDTKTFNIEIKELEDMYNAQILDVVNVDETILATGYSNDGTNVDELFLLAIDPSNNSYQMISNNFLSDLSKQEITITLNQNEVILTENYLYSKANKDGKTIFIKKDINSDKEAEIIYTNEIPIENTQYEITLSDITKKQIVNIVFTNDQKLNFTLLDAKTGEVKNYDNINTEKFKIDKDVGFKEYTMYINKFIFNENKLILSGGIPLKTEDQSFGLKSHEMIIEIFDLNTKQSIYLGEYTDGMQIYEYVD